ncbi:hypothetical protein KXD40_008917 [Peronospora effusa]|uniref:Uncharacterized protein n=1 Tax=Peronospora effusa TaxID=542832 RepID=A0A3M6VAG3_9STRA|nr:hypothetical protein DD238_008138 [Peronospora effusa]RQM11086.1 hypothetical protein DD237_007976 [Peronospora effusa]UIZ21878.1 hypothetical protein KXD40_008917 [Peronospora effusa]CAI5703759.1 unnamed protein product [Peronospora effusa]
MWWGERGDVEHAVAQLGGVQWCSEGVNARVDSELLEDEMLSSCRQETADYDVMDLLHPSQELRVPSEEQTSRLCRSEACVAWLKMAVEAQWLPECKYRQSQTTFRSLAETLLRIRGNLVDTFGEGVVVAPNASLFREFYKLNQLANLLSAKKEGLLNEKESPIPHVARQMTAIEDARLTGSKDDLQSTAVVEPPKSISGTSTSGTFSTPSSGSITPSSSANLSSSTTTSNSSSVEKISSGSDINSSDAAGFTNSADGPHASSTVTTTELTPSYAYVIGAWILFNGSFFLLMRRK